MHANIQVMEIPDRERILEEIMAEKLPNLMKIINLHIQAAPQSPSRKKNQSTRNVLKLIV